MENPLPSPEEQLRAQVEKTRREKLRLAIVDTSESVEDQARDIAEERLTANKTELKGFKGFFKKIWKHNWFREYYRQKEIIRVKGEMVESGNLYHHETADKTAHEEAMKNVVERFVSEYEETLHEGEKRGGLDLREKENQKMNREIRGLIREFATGQIDEAALIEGKNRVIADVLDLEGDSLETAVRQTDNFVEVARQAKLAVEHGASMDEIDREIEIVKGNARVGVRTEAKYNLADRIISKINKSFIGKYIFNETIIAGGVSIAYAATVGLAQRAARSKALAWATLGGSAAVGGTIAALNERVRLEDERSQHAREMAKGKEIGADSPRRKEMEESRYETKTAVIMKESLEHSIQNIKSQEDFLACISLLSGVEARIKLSDTENIDLIQYSDFKSIEKERLDLDIARARAKVALRQMVADNKINIPGGKPFDEFYSGALNVQSGELCSGDKGIEKKNEIFNKMKSSKSWKAFRRGVVTGLVVGTAVQEGMAFFQDSREGLVENLVGADDQDPSSVTMLEGARRSIVGWFNGDEGTIRPGHNVDLADGSHVTIPDGVEITPNPANPGQFIFTKDGDEIANNIEFKGGVLTPASEALLESKGINIDAKTALISSGASITEEVKGLDYAKGNPDFKQIRRDFWYDNNTQKFDKNELRLHWGGIHGTGVDAKGNYIYSVAKMKSGDSFFKGWSVDAQKAFRNKELKMLLSLSRDSQAYVAEVPIDENGNAVIKPDSDIAKKFFKLDSKGQLHFIGKFAEVGHHAGAGKDGVDHFRILATDVGPGYDKVTKIIEKPPVEFTRTTFEVTDPAKDLDTEPPMFIPIAGRDPLEKLIQATIPPHKRSLGYGNEKIKKYHSDLNRYRNSPELCIKLRHKLEADKSTGIKYKYLFDRLDMLDAFPTISKANLENLQNELQRNNKHFFGKDSTKYINIDDFVKIERWRLYKQLENIAVQSSEPGENPFDTEFYKESPLISGINRAEEIVVILDNPFGDAVLTIPAVMALEAYLKKKGLNKAIKLVTSHTKLFDDVSHQFKHTSVIDYNAIDSLNNGKEKFVINAHKEFENYTSLGLSGSQINDPAYVMSVDWQNWQREEIPHEKGKIEKLDPIPSRILRNFEVMLGEKLFDNINAMDHFLEKGPGFNEKAKKIRDKYALGTDKIVAITAGTSVQPKEYSPERWAEVLAGIQKEHPDMQILFLKDPDQARWDRYKDTIARIQQTNKKVKIVEEPLENITTILSMADVFVSPDTGFGHVASALGTPNVALVLGDPIRWSTANTVRVMHPTKSKEIYYSQSGSYSEAWAPEFRDKYYVENEKEKVGASDIDPKDILKGINTALGRTKTRSPFGHIPKKNEKAPATPTAPEIIIPTPEISPEPIVTSTANTPAPTSENQKPKAKGEVKPAQKESGKPESGKKQGERAGANIKEKRGESSKKKNNQQTGGSRGNRKGQSDGKRGNKK